MIGRATWYVSCGITETRVIKEVDIPLGVLKSWEDCDKHVMSKLMEFEDFYPMNDEVKIEYVNHISTVKIVR